MNWRSYRRATPACVLLVALLGVATAAAAAQSALDREAGVMRMLRQALYNADSEWTVDLLGWRPDDPTRHCLWDKVRCNNDSRVVSIAVSINSHEDDEQMFDTLNGRDSLPMMPPGAKSPLMPELAQLEWIEKLDISHGMRPLPSGIPAEWLTPGAFPRLEELTLVAGHLPDPLPDIPPGVLTSLATMHLSIKSLRTTLPATWGQPGVLPALRRLSLEVQFQGGLPPEWSQGFRQLELLIIFRTTGGVWASPTAANAMHGLDGSGGHVSSPQLAPLLPGAAPIAGGDRVPLPAAWADGFPRLRHMTLNSCGSTGAIPAAWIGGGFPSLTTLQFTNMSLSGTLPAQLLHHHLALQELAMPGNLFTGTLPEAWAASKIKQIQLSSNNLSGSAFPASWTTPDAFPVLSLLELTRNPGPRGTLPDTLKWPHLVGMDLDGTGLTGTIPASWCLAPFRRTILYMEETLPCRARFAPGAGVVLRICRWACEPALCQWRMQLCGHRDGTGLSSNNNGNGSDNSMYFFPQQLNLSMQERPWRSTLSGPPRSGLSRRPRSTESTLRCSWLRGTSVDPLLPACAATDLPRFGVNRVAGEDYQARYRNQHSGAPVPSPALLLLLAAVAATAVATGRALWRKHGRQHARAAYARQHGHDEEVRRLDVARPLVAGSSEGSGSGGASSIQGSPDLGRQARLAALLKAHIGGQGGSLAETLRLLPVEALPEALAHHVGTAACLGASSRGDSQQARASQRRQRLTNAADVELERKHNGADAHPLLTTNLSTAQVEMSLAGWADGDVERQRSGRGGEACPLLATSHGSAQVEMSMARWPHGPGSSGTADVGIRRWGLDTQSLLVSAMDLTFFTYEDGQPVSLGTGSQGAVFLARLQSLDVAVKIYELLPGMESSALWKEAQLLRNCTHPHIVPLLGVALKGPLLMLVMWWMRGGSLRLALQTPDMRERLAWRRCGHQVAADVAGALAYMHGTLHIMHSDLKSSNVLLSSDLRGHVADLGVARVVGSAGRTAAGYTRMYAAPEQLMGQKCTLAADIYSLGIVLVELTTREMGSGRGEWRMPIAPSECPQEVVSLITDCLQIDPQLRPGADQVVTRLRAAGVG